MIEISTLNSTPTSLVVDVLLVIVVPRSTAISAVQVISVLLSELSHVTYCSMTLTVGLLRPDHEI